MRADKSQIPVKPGQTASQTNAGTKPTDNLWAQLRRLKAQIESIELAISTARRDINRIDRKQYREDKVLPPSELKVNAEPGNGQLEHHPALFG